MGHVTLITPLLGVLGIHRLRFYTFHLYAKVEDSSLAAPGISLGSQKFKVCHVTLTTPLLRVSMLVLDIGYSLPVYKI